MRGEVRLFDPFHGGAVQWLRFAGEKLAEKKLQMDGFFGVVMADFLEQFTHGDLHAEFFADFADEALLKGLARLALAAGEFPQAAEVRIRMALGDQEFSVAKDERGAYFNDK